MGWFYSRKHDSLGKESEDNQWLCEVKTLDLIPFWLSDLWFLFWLQCPLSMAFESFHLDSLRDSKMIDCSEAVPIPVPAINKPATFPAGTGPELLQLSCNSPFPSLSTDRKLSYCLAIFTFSNEPCSRKGHHHPGVRWRWHQPQWLPIVNHGHSKSVQGYQEEFWNCWMSFAPGL